MVIITASFCKIAGYKNNAGYIVIKIKGILYYAHRLAWLYMYGKFPKKLMDHINHDRLDNRICNLRCVSHSGNHKNKSMAPTNTSGCTGVSWDKVNSKWLAQITHNKRAMNLGRYKTFNEAKKARQLAERKYGFHKNHGRAA